MQAPLFVRALTEEERKAIEAGRRSSAGFTIRRSQMWPVGPAEENYNVKLSVSLASQLRGRGSPFLTYAEWPSATINCIFYPFMLLSHFL
jgi:hypothetical protein